MPKLDGTNKWQISLSKTTVFEKMGQITFNVDTDFLDAWAMQEYEQSGGEREVAIISVMLCELKSQNWANCQSERREKRRKDIHEQDKPLFHRWLPEEKHAHKFPWCGQQTIPYLLQNTGSQKMGLVTLVLSGDWYEYWFDRQCPIWHTSSPLQPWTSWEMMPMEQVGHCNTERAILFQAPLYWHEENQWRLLLHHNVHTVKVNMRSPPMLACTDHELLLVWGSACEFHCTHSQLHEAPQKQLHHWSCPDA